MNTTTYTNSSLATARTCLTKYDLQYLQRLERGADEEREALLVGTCWHKAHEVAARGGNPFDLIRRTAPNVLWAEKLGRLFAAYRWYWQNEQFEVVEPEKRFRVEYNGHTFEGSTDGVIRWPDGRLGLIERKTCGEDIGPAASYWDRLAMDTQTGLYSLAVDFIPAFVLYDVVRKPTINPKNLPKPDVARMRKEINATGQATYFAETFSAEHVEACLAEGRESIALYGARLTADIGDRPDYYFARRPVDRTTQDLQTLLGNIDDQVRMIEHGQREGLLFRNPDACSVFGLCPFFALCSNNIRPHLNEFEGEKIPDGYRQREHLHPELA